MIFRAFPTGIEHAKWLLYAVIEDAENLSLSGYLLHRSIADQHGGMTLFSAIRLATKAHHGQLRLDGTPYIEHPLAVLNLLWEISLDLPLNVSITAVLHDILEDTDMTYETLHEYAGSDIAAVVRVLTKDNLYYNLPTMRREKMYLDRIRAANAIYPYTLLIKLADRLHNVRTADALPIERKWKLLRETRDLYLPLAERLLSDLPANLRPIYRRCMDQLSKALEDHRLPQSAPTQKNFPQKILLPLAV